jgi:hypothetical protein
MNGCGRVFDDAELFDNHRVDGECENPVKLGMVRNKGGVWIEAVQVVTRRRQAS